jgi:hypothetical protein
LPDVVIDQNHVLVPHVPKVYQFERGRSAFRCEAFTLVALSLFAYPAQLHWDGRDFSGLNALASHIYAKYTGSDVPENTSGMNKEQMLDWFHLGHIGSHDLQALVDAARASGDWDELRHEMGAMNKSGIPVSLGIDDESHLKTPDGKKLHSWNDVGLGHAIIRLGMDLQQPITFILDPAAPCPPFPFPTPVLWSDLVQCRINTAIGVMPHGVSAPPPDFRFSRDGQDFVWPVPEPPKPVVDIAAIVSQVEALKAEEDARFEQIIAELKAKA